MRAFANLYTALDVTTKTSEKVEALVSYFRAASPEDAVWAMNFLIGRRPKRLIKSADLREWARESADIPAWLFEDCYTAVGDMAETISLLLPAPERSSDLPLHTWVEDRLFSVNRESLQAAWAEMDETQRFVWNKLITGSFRVGVSQSLVVRAVAEVSGINAEVIAHRLMGDWQPVPAFYGQLLAKDTDDADASRPYPFYLAYPREDAELGPATDWIAEWKWDGIRSQVIRRKWRTYIWSRGEELITDRFPEIEALGGTLPDGTVIDGEILPWKDGKPLPFAQLQRRIGRKVPGAKILADIPVVLLAYDLLEWQGRDVRDWPIERRRDQLKKLGLLVSEEVPFSSWEELATLRQTARERGVEGFMLKRVGSPYRTGRKRGDWWKWKIEPFLVDCVLTYAQAGHGRRATVFTDYTFGVWKDGQLVTFAKAYSGLTDKEIDRVDAWIKRNTIEKFGPVRQVKPELVFELAFEGINKSTRHKSGIAVRFPRINRWREDKPANEADSIETIEALLG